MASSSGSLALGSLLSRPSVVLCTLGCVAALLAASCEQSTSSPESGETAADQGNEEGEPLAAESVPVASAAASAEPAPSDDAPGAGGAPPAEGASGGDVATGVAEPAKPGPTLAEGSSQTGRSKSASSPGPGPSKPEPPKAEPEKPKEPAKYSGDKPCKATKFKFSSVRQACEKGGIPEAKSLMKYIVRKAKKQGTRMKCKTCHTSLKSYELKDNGVADLRKWL